MSSEQKTNKWRLLIPLVAIAVGVFTASYFLIAAHPFFTKVSDVPQYIVVGRMLVSGMGSNVYDVTIIENLKRQILADNNGGIAVLSPPFGIVLFAPLGLINPRTIMKLWLPMSLLLSVISLCLLRRALRLPWLGFLWLIAACVIYWPWLEALRIGQITPLLLFSLSLATYFFQSSMVGLGSALGIGALSLFVIKPQYMLPFVFYLIGARRYQLLIVGAGIVTILSVIALLAIGVHGYSDYCHFLSHLDQFRYIMQPEICPTIKGELLRIPSVSPLMVLSISTIALVFVLAFSYLLGVKNRNRADWYLVWLACIFPITMLTASLAHNYDLTLLIPSAVALAVLCRSMKLPPWLIIPGMIIFILCSLPIGLLLHFKVVRSLAVINPFFVMLLLYASGAAWIGWRRSESNDDAANPS